MPMSERINRACAMLYCIVEIADSRGKQIGYMVDLVTHPNPLQVGNETIPYVHAPLVHLRLPIDVGVQE